jgi:hypothetical protein
MTGMRPRICEIDAGVDKSDESSTAPNLMPEKDFGASAVSNCSPSSQLGESIVPAARAVRTK